jgi:hypothetical protein
MPDDESNVRLVSGRNRRPEAKPELSEADELYSKIWSKMEESIEHAIKDVESYIEYGKGVDDMKEPRAALVSLKEIDKHLKSHKYVDNNKRERQ